MIGKQISHYKILEKLGEGGMGIVYKAEDTKLKRIVALKFISPSCLKSEDEKTRFTNEAQAAAAINHANITTIYEINEYDNDTFISMEYIEGESLKDKIESGPLLKIDESLEIAIQLAEGLQEAHQKGIIHRDIKSANIMITEKGQAKIMDFGLAKLRDQTKLTKDGTTLGTAAYMSPEQSQGKEVDHKTDIWSLGVVLYEMITGQLPFKGDYEQAIVYSIMNEEPEPVTGIRTGVPQELERIINKALVKKSSDRYQHTDDMMVDLRKIREETKQQIKITKKHTGTSTGSGPRKLLLPVIFLLAVIVIIGGYIIFKGKKTARPAAEITAKTEKISENKWKNSIAVLPFVDLSPEKDQEYFCDGMTEQIISNLTKLQKLKVTARTSVMKFKKTDKTIPQIGSELKVAYVLEGSLRKLGDQIRVTAQLIKVKDGFHLWSEDYNREYKQIFDVWDDISEKIAQALLEKLSIKEIAATKTKRPNNLEAYNNYLRAEHLSKKRFLYGLERSHEIFKNGEDLYKKAIELDPGYAPAYAGLADLYDTFSAYVAQTKEEKKKYLELSEEYTEIAFNLDPASAQVIFMKGVVCWRKGDFDQQWKYYKTAYKINPNDTYIVSQIGIFFMSRGLFHQAVKTYDKTIELDPLYFNFIRARAYYLALHLGKFDQAKMGYQKVLKLLPNDQRALYQYSWVLFMMKKYDTAREMIEKYNKLYPDSNQARQLKAILFAFNGEKDKALGIKLDRGWKAAIYQILQMKEEYLQFEIENSENAKKRRQSYYLKYKNHPLFDFLRSDSRFQKIMAEHKMLYEENLRKFGDLKVN